MNRRNFLYASQLGLTSLMLPGLVQSQSTNQGRWQSAKSLPFAVQEIYPAILNNTIHVAGGFAVAENGQRGITNQHLQYDIDKQQWKILTPLPEARHHPNLVTCNNGVYALGGFAQGSDGTWVMQNQTWRYSNENNTWQTLNPAPEVHGETVCLANGYLIHVIGGRHPRGEKNNGWSDHTDVNRHLVFDTNSNTWNRAAPALTSRNSAAGAVINDKFYVVGGRTVGGGNVASLEIYDAQEDKWREGAPMPQAQGGLGAAALNNKLIAFGGEFFGAAGGGVYAEAWAYDPLTDNWSAIAAMPTPRHGLGGVSDGNAIYAIAGAKLPGGNETSAAMEIFTF